MGIKGKIIKVWNLSAAVSLLSFRQSFGNTHFVQRLYQFWMLVSNVLLNKRRRFKKLRAMFTPKFTLILLFDIWFHSFAQLSAQK